MENEDIKFVKEETNHSRGNEEIAQCFFFFTKNPSKLKYCCNSQAFGCKHIGTSRNQR